jgi:Nuclease-related domain
MMGSDAQSTPAALKKLRLRYAGICVLCAAALPQGAQAFYHSGSKTVRCIVCPDEADVTEAAPLDVGTAGGSAQREHDRRAVKRQERVKERFGRRFGGLLLAMTDEPQSTRAWAKGARGEEKLAEAIADLPDVVALHDRRVPGMRGNIDHLLVAPAGLFVVDAKHYKDSLRIRDKGGLFHTDNRLYVGGRDCSHLADNMAWQVAAVETLLASVEVMMPVTPALCFIDVDWPLLFAPDSFRGVRLHSPKSLRKLITATPALDAAAIDMLARILAAGFPAK